MKFDGMFETIENLCETVAPLQVEVWTSPEPLPFERRFEGTFQKLEIGRSWGSLFDCGWFRFPARCRREKSRKNWRCGWM